MTSNYTITPPPAFISQTSTPPPAFISQTSTPPPAFTTQTSTPPPAFTTQTLTPPPALSKLKKSSHTQFWIYKEAWNYFEIISKILGEPDKINTCSGGFITWFKSPNDTIFGMRNVFTKHILRDQAIPVNYPRTQFEFFYSYLKYKIKHEKISNILSISPSISYDPLLGEICVRGINLGQNIILMSLVIQLDNDSLKIRDIHANGMISKYLKDSEKPTAIIDHYRTLNAMIPEIKAPITNEIIQNARKYKHNPFPIMFKE